MYAQNLISWYLKCQEVRKLDFFSCNILSNLAEIESKVQSNWNLKGLLIDKLLMKKTAKNLEILAVFWDAVFIGTWEPFRDWLQNLSPRFYMNKSLKGFTLPHLISNKMHWHFLSNQCFFFNHGLRYYNNFASKASELSHGKFFHQFLRDFYFEEKQI